MASNDKPKPRTPGQAAKAALAAVLRERAAQARALDARVAELLLEAVRRVVADLAAAPTDYQQWVLPRLLDRVRVVADQLGTDVGLQVHQALQVAWDQGLRLVNDPVQAAHQVEAAAGSGTVQSSPMLVQASDLRQLRGIQAFTTQFITGATGDMVKIVNRELGQVLVGTQTPFEALKRLRTTLPEKTDQQLRTIVNSNVAQAFTSASRQALEAQAARDPELMKQWRRSGKLRARWNHAAADGQVQDVDKPFVLFAGNRKGALIEMMQPCDPKAPLAEILNCGCVALPWKKSWRMRVPAAVPEKGRKAP